MDIKFNESITKENRKFWSKFPIKNNGLKLLIEEPGLAMLLHTNAVFAVIINQAKGYTPVWLSRENCPELQLLRSYFPNVEVMTTDKKWLFKKIYAAVIAFFKFIKLLFFRNILKIHYDGVQYGDIIYDTYLAENEVATVRKINLKMLKIISKCIFRHIKIKTVLQSGKYAGVLTSHQQGIGGGVMLRCALRYNYEAYLHTGHHQSTMMRFYTLGQAKTGSPHKPFPSDVRETIKQLGSKLNEVFIKVFENEVAGKGSIDGPNAFSKDHAYYTDRMLFNKDFKLDANKKNVFVMLHAFNDHPHTTFRWMIFKDYYNWFIKTLKFAKKDSRVNWIFKQHPSIKNYPARDVNFEQLFLGCPDNVIYIGEDRQIDTRSLIYCADSIVTCHSSAGFELPAMGAIPSITAGDNAYSELNFVQEPKTETEYFEILKRIDKIEKLPAESQNIAKAVYIYIYKISRIDLTVCPSLSRSQLKDKTINSWYFNEVIKQYLDKENIIMKELNNYIEAVKKPGFKKLITEI